MDNSNHILNQILKDEKKEEKPTLIEFVNRTYEAYINTLNNEKENTYLNQEDPRSGGKIEYLHPNEIGLRFENKSIFFGNCKRNLFFKLTGAIKSDTQLSEVEAIERNNLVKEQWKRKFEFLGLLEQEEEKNIEVSFKKLGDIKIHTTSDGIIKDFVAGRESTLLIKPLNDSAFVIKDKVFSEKGSPMWEHIAEAAILMFAHKRQVKLLYVGKNNSETYKEYQIGSEGGFITINGEIRTDIPARNMYKEFDAIVCMFNENLIPPRDYPRPRSLSPEEINEYVKYGTISGYRDENEYLNGKEYEAFRCTVCKYKTLCNSISDGWLNKE
ncbi:MAG: hypothetical protein ACRCXX_14445 [Cetobacterium sp.]|uniref:hypothetical protein n=1 Tax=Cetobacterium sp. TaxID=2071632 RepID=UPI003F31131C